MFGYTGRILQVDLTQGTFSIQTFDEAFARKYLGGNGFAAKILYDGLKPGIDPFSPENLVVFAVGPVTDTPFPSTSRAYAATKSPLNGLFFDSTFGGRFAITQKRTGFEAIVISGKAKEPVYLRVDENGAELKSAAAVWGKTTKETVEACAAKLGKTARSVIAKLSREGVYKVEAKVVNHGKRLSKAEQVEALANKMGVPAAELESLEKASAHVIALLAGAIPDPVVNSAG